MFRVIESATVDGKVASAVTPKYSIKDAEMLYHQVMASMLANDNVTEGLCTILDEDGRQMFEFTSHYYNPGKATE